MLVIHWIEIIIAGAGLVFAIVALLRSNWHVAAKIIGGFIGGSLLITLAGMMATGILTKDHAGIVLAFGVAGAVILAGLAVRRWNTGWHPWAIGLTVLIVIAIMMLTFSSTPPVTPVPTIPTLPIAPPSPVVYAPPLVAPPPPAPPRRTRSGGRRFKAINCDDVPPDFKASSHCPE